MEQNLDITNKFPQSLGTSLNRGSTVVDESIFFKAVHEKVGALYEAE